tara:strand:+ start:112048 stop:112389 length:342 start_codon:yes stop_codon:yes gene_type:complete
MTTEATMLDEVLARLEYMGGGASVHLYVLQSSSKDASGTDRPFYEIIACPVPRESIDDTPEGSVVLFGDRHSTGGDHGKHVKNAALICVSTILTVIAGMDVYVDDELFDPRQQ